MRTIKFRAWDKPNNQIIQHLIISLYEDGSLGVERGGRTPGDTEDFVLMQYTGLNDKNGVEIYEGDILRISWLSGSGQEMENIVEVKWVDEESKFTGVSINTVFTMVVIGNIYENPELLK